MAATGKTTRLEPFRTTMSEEKQARLQAIRAANRSRLTLQEQAIANVMNTPRYKSAAERIKELDAGIQQRSRPSKMNDAKRARLEAIRAANAAKKAQPIKESWHDNFPQQSTSYSVKPVVLPPLQPKEPMDKKLRTKLEMTAAVVVATALVIATVVINSIIPALFLIPLLFLTFIWID